jgi:hypothetical protein
MRDVSIIKIHAVYSLNEGTLSRKMFLIQIIFELKRRGSLMMSKRGEVI